MSRYEDLAFHRILIADRARSNAYRRAIRAVVRDGDVVLDLGTGSGLLALFACEAGAARVYAIERTPIIAAARQLARANAFEDRIEFIESDIRAVTLPQKVDVVVSELLSKAYLGQQMETLTCLCRERFLKPQGRMVPERVDLFVAPVRAEEAYREIEFPGTADYDIDFTTLRELAANTVQSARLSADDFLAAPRLVHSFVASSSSGSDRVQATLTFDVQRAGTLRGFGTWFVANLAEGIALDTHPPGLPSWDNAFFPLLRPIEVRHGMKVELRITGVDVEGRVTWAWKTVVRPPDDSRDEAVVTFAQSSFLGIPLSPRLRARTSESFRPALSASGNLLRAVMDACDGRTSTHEIVEHLEGRPEAGGETHDVARRVPEILAELDERGHLTR